MAELIQKTDTLNEGREKINAAITDAEQAKVTAGEADSKATQALSNSESTQTQLDTIVIEGDSSVEAAQARVDEKGVGHTTLKERIDDGFTRVTTQLSNGMMELADGVVKLPDDFPEIPFEISKHGRNFGHNATPHNQYNWNNAVNIFISSTGSSTVGSGKEKSNPITLGRFSNVYSSGFYNNNTFILNFIDDIYTFSDGLYIIDRQVNILFRSDSPSGFTWILPIIMNNDPRVVDRWNLDGGVYKAKVNGQRVAEVVNLKNIDIYGMPRNVYQEVSSLAECISKKGTLYVNNGVIYCNPHSNEKVEDVHFIVYDVAPQIHLRVGDNKVCMFENIGFGYDTLSILPETLTSKIYFFGSKFWRGKNDALALKNLYQVFLFECVAAYPSKDCFNYHTTSYKSLAVEINCIAYGAGLFKMRGGNTDTNSNNATTTHEGMYSLRVGGVYYDCEGPIVADIGNPYTINIGCSSFHCPTTNTGLRASYYVSNSEKLDREITAKKIFVDCISGGKNIVYSVYGDDGNETYISNIKTSGKALVRSKYFDYNEFV